MSTSGVTAAELKQLTKGWAASDAILESYKRQTNQQKKPSLFGCMHDAHFGDIVDKTKRIFHVLIFCTKHSFLILKAPGDKKSPRPLRDFNFNCCEFFIFLSWPFNWSLAHILRQTLYKSDLFNRCWWLHVLLKLHFYSEQYGLEKIHKMSCTALETISFHFVQGLFPLMQWQNLYV